jgi:plasmid stabilization system protein ParE
MSLKIVKRPKAILDILAIADYLAKDDDRLAGEFIDAVDVSLRFLADFPHSGEVVPTRKPEYQGLRLWQIKGFPNHLILFRATEDQVEVFDVFHGSRDLPSVLRSLT